MHVTLYTIVDPVSSPNAPLDMGNAPIYMDVKSCKNEVSINVVLGSCVYPVPYLTSSGCCPQHCKFLVFSCILTDLCFSNFTIAGESEL